MPPPFSFPTPAVVSNISSETWTLRISSSLRSESAVLSLMALITFVSPAMLTRCWYAYPCPAFTATMPWIIKKPIRDRRHMVGPQSASRRSSALRLGQNDRAGRT